MLRTVTRTRTRRHRAEGPLCPRKHDTIEESVSAAQRLHKGTDVDERTLEEEELELRDAADVEAGGLPGAGVGAAGEEADDLRVPLVGLEHLLGRGPPQEVR